MKPIIEIGAKQDPWVFSATPRISFLEKGPKGSPTFRQVAGSIFFQKIELSRLNWFLFSKKLAELKKM